MVTTTIRVSSTTRDKLRVLAEQERRPIGDIVAAAVDRYEEEAFWAEAHRAYAAMRADPAASAAFDAEVAAWDGTLRDGLEGLEDGSIKKPVVSGGGRGRLPGGGPTPG